MYKSECACVRLCVCVYYLYVDKQCFDRHLQILSLFLHQSITRQQHSARPALGAYWVFTGCLLGGYWVFTGCLLGGYLVFTGWLLGVLYLAMKSARW